MDAGSYSTFVRSSNNVIGPRVDKISRTTIIDDWVVSVVPGIKREVYEDGIEVARRGIINTYLKRHPAYIMSEDSFLSESKNITHGEIKSFASRVLKSIGYIAKHNKDNLEISWKLITTIGIMTVVLSPSDSVNGLYGIMVIITDLESFTTTVAMVKIDPSNNSIGIDGPFVTAKDINKSKETINMHQKNGSMLYQAYILYILTKALYVLKNKRPTNDEIPPHNPIELYFISRAMRKCPAMEQLLNLFWDTGEDEDGNKIKGKNSFTDLYLELAYNTDPYNVPPYIDLSENEWRYVFKYIDKKGIVKKGGPTIPLLDILKSPRFGRRVRVPVKLDDHHQDNTYEVLVDFIIKEEDDEIVMFIRYDCSEDFTLIHTIYFYNITSFKAFRDVSDIRCDLIMKNKKNLPASMPEVTAISPPELLETNNIISIIGQVMSIYIVMYDRPEKMKVVRETTKNPKYARGGKNKNREPEFLIRRLLKTSASIKEYVKRISEGGSVDKQYVVESWDRVGHWRTLASGRTIWVGSTTCNRKLPLSKQELHIKL